MRFIIQRVRYASVTVDGQILGRIGKGLMVLIGIGQGDDKDIADKMVHKLLHMRIFEDHDGKTNLDLSCVKGGLLLIPQFTLYADCRKGNRPSFVKAADPQSADQLYGYIIQKCKGSASTVEQGRFGADMKVKLLNDGPFTILLDSEELGFHS